MGHGPRQLKKAILIHGRPRSLEIREGQERLEVDRTSESSDAYVRARMSIAERLRSMSGEERRGTVGGEAASARKME
jgi:hypothetical protein